MRYFENCKTLDELKKEFRRLAMIHHPDRGGDVEVMQKINAEYEKLFPVLKLAYNQTAAVPNHETADGYRRDFYSQNGWCGKNYNSRLTTKEITAKVREYVKNAYPDCKFSVRFSSYSGGSSIHVALMSGPYAALKSEKNHGVNQYYIDIDTEMTEWAKAVMIDVNDFIKSYRWSDCDSMTDYFDVNFWYDLDVGRWDKGYEINNKIKKLSGDALVTEKGIRIVYNEEKNGVEAYFDSIPSPEVRASLRNNGFRWHGGKKCWYKKRDDASVKFLNELAA